MAKIQEWPFPGCNRDTWIESTEKSFDHLMGSVPPAFYVPGGFVVGEPYSHDNDGVAVCTVCVKVNQPYDAPKYFFRYARTDQAHDLAAELLNPGHKPRPVNRDDYDTRAKKALGIARRMGSWKDAVSLIIELKIAADAAEADALIYHAEG